MAEILHIAKMKYNPKVCPGGNLVGGEATDEPALTPGAATARQAGSTRQPFAWFAYFAVSIRPALRDPCPSVVGNWGVVELRPPKSVTPVEADRLLRTAG